MHYVKYAIIAHAHSLFVRTLMHVVCLCALLFIINDHQYITFGDEMATLGKIDEYLQRTGHNILNV